ncbi:MAG: DMT family transporter [Thermoplasmata archaeon]|nr:DMT family transporter [Thermoplasmata archaeon]
MESERENGSEAAGLNRESLVYLIGTSLFYGLLIVVQKMGLNEGLDPLSFSFSRSFIIIGLSLLYFTAQEIDIKPIPGSILRELAIIASISAISILILFIGQKNTTAVNAGFLIRLTPLFVVPLCTLILGKRFSRDQLSFMFVMLLGAFLLTTEGILMMPQNGDLLIIGATFMIAFQNVFARKLMLGVSQDIVIFSRIFGSALLIVIFTPLFLGRHCLDAMYSGAFYVALSAILYFISVVCHYRAIRLVGAFLASTFFLLGSLFSALFANVLLGEGLSTIQWFGSASILIGGYILIRKGSSQ